MANSPGVSSMDFFGNGRLKTATKKRKHRTLRELKAAAKDECSKIPVEQFQNALSSWSKRVLEIHEAKGRSLFQWKKFQVENCIFEIKPKSPDNVTESTCSLPILASPLTGVGASR